MKRIIGLLMLVSVAVAACSSGGGVVATVGDSDITFEEVEALRVRDDSIIDSAVFAEDLTNIIIERLAVEDARERFGLELTEADIQGEVDLIKSEIEGSSGLGFDEFLEGQGLTLTTVELVAEQRLLQTKVIDQLISDLPSPSEEEVEATYNSLLQQLSNVCARHILVETEEQADEVLAELEAGAEFAELAIEKSLDPGSGEAGGDLGCRSPSGYVANFAVATLEADIGVPVSVQSEFGYHIIIVDERQVPTLEESRDDIEAQILFQQQDQVLNDWLVEAIAEADISVSEEYGTWVPETNRVAPPS